VIHRWNVHYYTLQHCSNAVRKSLILLERTQSLLEVGRIEAAKHLGYLILHFGKRQRSRVLAFPSRVSNHRPDAPTVGGIRLATNKTIGLKPIDQLSHVRPHTGESLSQFPERERTGGPDENAQDVQLGE
jgi:hypothetical protein